MKKPSFSPFLFGDTDVNLVDWGKNANTVIIRVLERGNLDDFRELRRYYDDEKIKYAVTTARSVFKKAVHFTSAFYQIPLENFRCYKNDAFPDFPLSYSSMT